MSIPTKFLVPRSTAPPGLILPGGIRPASNLPPIVNAGVLMADASIVMPPELVHGVLHQGLKGILAGASKAGKTWLLMDLALSVANGFDWLQWHTTQGRVLLVNFEIPEAFIKQRLDSLRQKKLAASLQGLDLWNLRGFSAPFKELVPQMIQELEDKQHSLIILDPIYKGLAGQDENSAGDIAEFCNQIEDLAVKTRAAVVYAHHYSKGKQANKATVDRIGGSGVFARDADSIITFTEHDEKDCYVVDCVLRNLPQVKPFVVRWQFPLMVLQTNLDPAKLKGRQGRPEAASAAEVLNLLEDGPLTTKEWQQGAMEQLDIAKATFGRRKKELAKQGKIEQNDDGKWELASGLE